MNVTTCPACGSNRLLFYPRSKRSGQRDFRCRRCGLAGWADRGTAPQKPVGLDQISVEQRTNWIGLKRGDVTDDARHESLAELEQILGGAQGHRLYDIGANDGYFLDLARRRGFGIRGNDLMAAAVEIARDRYGIDLDLGDISTLNLDPNYDVVTLWCVLAHVPDPDALLAGCWSILRPGGVLFIQTPHRCAVDVTALELMRASGGRVSRWVDRRIAGHHWILHTARSITAELTRLGFVDIDVRPKARYSLMTSAYLTSLGLRGRPAELIGAGVDGLIRRGAAPRIVLDVYARKPSAA